MVDEPLLFCNISKIGERHDLWKRNFPKVKPFYGQYIHSSSSISSRRKILHLFLWTLAVKCNTDSLLLKCLASLGTGFDCASKSEIKAVLDMGVSPDNIIFANPCKPQSHIRSDTSNLFQDTWPTGFKF